MKIAYILPNYCLIDGKSGGVRVQALQWIEYMRSAGHEVVEVSGWEDYDWNSFDIIQYFYFGFCYLPLYQAIKDKAPKARFICAPILDPHKSIFVYKLLSYIKIPAVKLWTEFSALRHYKDIFDVFLARTEFEKKYLIKAFGVNANKITIVPLNSRFQNITDDCYRKKDFCLHVSRLCDPTKNVIRLVKAALKYNFNLVLAGSSSESFNLELKRIIGSKDNVKILGRVSDEELIQLYKEAKVFALPSTREGVGLVALEAASYGCDIVITDIGGPKEYFLPNAIAVNPLSVDEIGQAVKKLLEGTTYQPDLKKQISSKFSEELVKNMLLQVYRSCDRLG